MKDQKLIKFNSFRQLCLKNAEDSLRAAEHLLGENLNHIVYHLAILALEEIGKIFMSWIHLNQEEDWGKESVKIAMDDHVKKLFYSIWGPTIGDELITKSQIENNRLIASLLHKKRLYSLYGDIEDNIQSSLKIDDEEINSIINFTKARLSLAQIDGEVNEEAEPNLNMEWFEKFITIPEKRNYVFGKAAQEKLIELGNVNEWVEWIKSSHENEQKELFELTERGMKKFQTSNINDLKPKWEITFTVITPSHSIRNNVLSAVNKIDRPIKLFSGKDKHTLIIKNVLPTNVLINELWYTGWISCKLFVAALNIGANGIFYWNTVVDIDKYYDYIIDLENNKRLLARLQAGLLLNWKEQRMYLTEENVHLAFLVYEYLVSLRDTEEAKPIMDYLSALGMLAKTDIHLHLELSAFQMFYAAFCRAVEKHQKPPEHTDILDLAYSQIDGMLKGRTEFDRTLKLGKELDENAKVSQPITLREVIAMKRYCEIYFLTISVRHYRKDNTIKLSPMTDGDSDNKKS